MNSIKTITYFIIQRENTLEIHKNKEPFQVWIATIKSIEVSFILGMKEKIEKSSQKVTLSTKEIQLKLKS